MSHARTYLKQASRINRELDADAIERLAGKLALLRERAGRLFVEAHRLGLNDIFDCAQYLGRVTQRFA
ncbi:MAG: hypothetical protein ACT4P2_05895 [Pseudomonadota bacterium]